MMYGYYVIKDGDKEIARSNNLITNMGKRYILNYFADKISDRSRYIGIGIGSIAATVNDYKLGFEINKYDVISSTVDFSSNTIILKAQLPIQLSAVISEMGLFPGIRNARQSDNAVVTFFNNDVSWSEGSYIESSANSKINSTSFRIESNSGSTVTAVSSDLQFDFFGYSTVDSLSLAFYQNDVNLDYIDLFLHTTETDYYSYRIEGTASSGHRIVEIPLVDLFANSVGNPTDFITKFKIAVKANSSTNTAVDFDGMRVNDNDTYVQETGAISRAVLASPITKEFGRILDLEYRLVIT